MIFRDVQTEDCDWILECRNDIKTRSHSFVDSPITQLEHREWFANSLTNPARKIMIIEHDRERICVMRLDLLDEVTVEFSINIAPGYRSKGYGTRIVTESGRYAKLWRSNIETIVAYVKQSNEASMKCFLKAGYNQLDSNESGTAKFVLRL